MQFFSIGGANLNNDGISRAKAELEEYLKQFGDAFVGISTGVGEIGEKVIRVYVRDISISPKIPKRYAGYKVVVIPTGRIVPLMATRKKRTDRWRPVPGGVSIGHKNVTAGTSGSLVVEKSTNSVYILTCNHVAANSDFVEIPRARRGDHVLQPGPIDGGKLGADTIGYLHKWSKLSLNKPVKLDAALVKPTKLDIVDDKILDIGVVGGIAKPRIGEKVIKSGRTTGVTVNYITDVDAKIRVDYPDGTVTLENQIVIGQPFASGGDSGSLVLNKNKEAVGIVVAGSDKLVVANPFSSIYSEFGVLPITHPTNDNLYFIDSQNNIYKYLAVASAIAGGIGLAYALSTNR
ncbi:hypothetical protein B6U74_01920 [Candidatus Bathyarchaeota archaeon ex4484_205]|nr:MAG: hypothetical protein B6U74_01920 [Candidatus Bathyarchaeota archaeon ex4484_205]